MQEVKVGDKIKVVDSNHKGVVVHTPSKQDGLYTVRFDVDRSHVKLYKEQIEIIKN